MFVVQGIVQIFTLAGQKRTDLMRVSGILTKITHCKYWCYRVSLWKQQSDSDQWKPTERESMLTSCKGKSFTWVRNYWGFRFIQRGA